MSVSAFWIVSGVIAVITGMGAILFSHNILIGLGVAFAVGVGAPRWFLGMRAGRRLKAFTEEFPNAIDVVVRGTSGGW